MTKMIEKIEQCEILRRQYPETISKNQFCRIAHISKATALYLLQSGLVPCKDSGKKTRRYTIRLDDVIIYLIDRELHPEIYRAPDLWYQKRSGHHISRVAYQNELTKLSDDDRVDFQKHIENELQNYDDLLKITEVVDVIG